MARTEGPDDADEFSFLPRQAAALGRTAVPVVRRVSLTLPDGRTLSALRFGEDPPQLTLLHGVGLNAHTWDTTLLALDRPALAIDLAGHGDSSWRQDADYSPGTLADDVIRGLEQWTQSPQTLVGHSLGGLTATAVAARRPDLVRDLVVIDLTPGVDPGAGPQQLRAFFAGPTDWASRDELVEHALSFGLGAAVRTPSAGSISTPASGPTVASSGSTTSRTSPRRRSRRPRTTRSPGGRPLCSPPRAGTTSPP